MSEDEPETASRAEALASCRIRLGLAMTRLSEAHWTVDRCVECWPATGAATVATARTTLDQALREYESAASSLLDELHRELGKPAR